VRIITGLGALPRPVSRRVVPLKRGSTTTLQLCVSAESVRCSAHVHGTGYDLLKPSKVLGTPESETTERSTLKPTCSRPMATKPARRSRWYPLRALRTKKPHPAASPCPQAALQTPQRMPRHDMRKIATAERRSQKRGRADMPNTRLPPPPEYPTAHGTTQASHPSLTPLHAPSDGFNAPRRVCGGRHGWWWWCGGGDHGGGGGERRRRWRRRRQQRRLRRRPRRWRRRWRW
jgi:hypothetical protein